MKKSVIILACMCCAIQQAFAAPIIIYDNGKAIDAQQFYPFKKPSVEDIKNIPRYTKKSIQQFPVASTMLTAGRAQSKRIKNTIPRAICVVGDDLRSKKWIKANAKTLQSINALCIVVNVESKHRFEAIKDLAPKVEFQALNGNILAKTYNVKHYPFLLNKDTIQQ